MNYFRLPALHLERDEERRLRAGHAWVFSNEVDVSTTSLTIFESGAAVEVQVHRGRSLGSGYVNFRSLIYARLLSRDRRRP
ncbi:MAG TPA: hypothetical protein VHJ19_08940 [Gammaproteobacteria bacterium]|nr:hypothetical protein [Gammaproteobacteria bacterium]